MKISETIEKLKNIMKREGDLVVCDNESVEIDYIGVYTGKYSLSEKKNNNMRYEKKLDGKYVCIA